MARTIATTCGGRFLLHVADVPPVAWLGLQAAALWTHWRWAAARFGDGSDDPLGLAAVVALLWAVARIARELRGHPRPVWLALALALSVTATAAVFVAPPLAGALLASLALVAGLQSVMPAGRALLPIAGLAVLALPVLSSLQFYAGYPLRVVTAQASTWLLEAAGVAAARSGSAMQVEGRLVIVDAPCSGVQMLWMAYFCGCVVALVGDVGDRRFVRTLPWVGAVVLAGNVLRNSVLVLLEARHDVVPQAWHEGIGLGVLALVCAGVVFVMRGARDDRA